MAPLSRLGDSQGPVTRDAPGSRESVEQGARLLGVAVGQQFHRALQVGEEYGDLLALPFESALRGEDLLSEVLRRVRLRGTELRVRSDGCRSQRPAAATAELLATLVQETA
jgi:hypothetical protein